MKPFDYRSAHSVSEALDLLAEHSPYARPIAGGTDLLVRMKRDLLDVTMLIDIAGVSEFKGIELTAKGLRIGSAVTHAEIAASSLVRQHAPALAAASKAIGATQTRNLGTIGGNLSSCVPSMDSAPPLLAHEAAINVIDMEGQKQMPLENFFLAPKCNILAPHQLLMEIIIPSENLDMASSFIKFGSRKALTQALVNASACIRFDTASNRFISARIALGAVAPTPIRARKAETFLEGKLYSEDILYQTGEIAAREAKPIDDHRASAQYRQELIKVLSRRVIADAFLSLKKGLK